MVFELKVPPATVQPEALAVALRLVSVLLVSTSPGLAELPSVRPSVLPPLNTSVALPYTLSWSFEEVYWVLMVGALKVPPAMVQLVTLAVALRLLSVLLVSTSPGLAELPSVRPSVLPPLKTSVALP